MAEYLVILFITDILESEEIDVLSFKRIVTTRPTHVQMPANRKSAYPCRLQIQRKYSSLFFMLQMPTTCDILLICVVSEVGGEVG